VTAMEENIRLRWKVSTVTNALAYSTTVHITEVVTKNSAHEA
jgi:hypothetical protein